MSKLPPITQALADAVTEAQERALEVARHSPAGSDHGELAPVGTRPLVSRAFEGAEEDDLHISLVGGPAARELYMAFIHAGATVPHTVTHADVVLGRGYMFVVCDFPDSNGAWEASIRPGARQWTWQDL